MLSWHRLEMTGGFAREVEEERRWIKIYFVVVVMIAAVVCRGCVQKSREGADQVCCCLCFLLFYSSTILTSYFIAGKEKRGDVVVSCSRERERERMEDGFSSWSKTRRWVVVLSWLLL
eukprot:TRINITY_DN490_c2_g2_i1.p1 TRINITY_DN490_c2_g2~~TRINITY_DN490_c2_g2_i1.p1  ORF type:complete len:118 (-),score=17.68 TRINITY_DN490_c2_g2_i1:214-567(-)